MSVAVDIAASGKQRVKREIVRRIVATSRADGEVLLGPGTLAESFRIVRSAEPGQETYVAEFECERRLLSCPLYMFLPRTRIVEPAL